MDANRIFICHAIRNENQEDTQILHYLMETFEKADIEVITNKDGDSEDSFSQLLQQELPTCQTLLLFQTSDAIYAPWVHQTVKVAQKLAEQQMMQIFRFICSPEEEAVPEEWRVLATFDGTSDYQKACEKLVLTISAGSTNSNLMQEAPTTIAPISSPSKLKTKAPKFRSRRDEGDKTRRKRKLLVGIVIALVSFTIIGSASTLLFLNLNRSQPNSPVAKNPIVGQVSFFGSGHIGTDNNSGICDEIHINLKNLTPPTAGHGYYAWLLPDMGNTEEGITTSLGRLTVNNGVASLTFANPTYQNLLLIGSRFLISEESSSATPSVPTPNQHAWRYYAALPHTPNPQDPNHYSNLDHVRHLLAKDPTLRELDMQGGLSTWFYTNVQKILEWANTAKGTG